jgi:hypothetical protein
VALQPAQPALLQPLTREQQVHAEGAADAADAEEQVDELRARGEQLAELVDDHEQVGHRRQGRVLLAALAVGADVVHVARVAQHLLAALLLAEQGVAHAIDQAMVALQVGDQAGGVRQPRELGEGGAALVVDQHEAERLRRMREREPRDERAHQLALAGAGGADDQPVRTETALGRLLEVEHDALARRRHADRDPQLSAARHRPPGLARVDLFRACEAEQVERAHLVGDRHPAVAILEAQRRQRARQGLRETDVAGVRPDAVPAPGFAAALLDRRRASRRQHDAQVGLGGLAVGRVREADDRDPEPVAAIHHLAHQRMPGGRRVRRVPVHEQHEARGADHDLLGPAGRLLLEALELLEPRPDLALEQLGEPLGRVGEQDRRGQQVGSVLTRAHLRARVREPLHPVPVGRVGPVVGGHQAQVAGRPERGELRSDGAHQRARLGRIADDRGDAHPVQVDHHRQVVDALPAPLDRARLVLEVALAVGHRVVADVQPHRPRVWHASAADSHAEEVAVAGAPLPEISLGEHQAPEPLVVGVQALGGGELEVGVARELPLDPGQVHAVLVAVAPAALADAAHLRPAHPRGEQEAQADEAERDVQEQPVPVDEREAQHREAADDREQRLHDAAARGLRLGRRRVDAQLLRRNRVGPGSRWPVERRFGLLGFPHLTVSCTPPASAWKRLPDG